MALVDTISNEERRELREACERALQGDGLRTAATRSPSSRGSRPTICRRRVRRGRHRRGPRGGGPRAARQAGGRVHAERHDGPADRAAGPRRPARPAPVAFHPTCHLELHEDTGRTSDCTGWSAGPLGDGRGTCSPWPTSSRSRAARRAAASSCHSARSAAGSRRWDDLVAQVAFARRPGRGRPPATVRACGRRVRSTTARWPRSPACSTPSTCRSTRGSADWPAACCSVTRTSSREAAPVAEAPRRHALSACGRTRPSGLAGLRPRLPRMAAYVAHAQAIGAALADVDGVARRPRPAADADDASAPANHRGRPCDGRHPSDGDRAAAVDLGRLVGDRDAGLPPGRAHRRRGDARVHAGRGRRCGLPAHLTSPSAARVSARLAADRCRPPRPT